MRSTRRGFGTLERDTFPGSIHSAPDTSPTRAQDVERSRRSTSGPARAARVEAVVVEHADGSCSCFRQGTSSHWPSLSAVIEQSTSLEWRQSTPGIWVGRLTPEGEEVAS